MDILAGVLVYLAGIGSPAWRYRSLSFLFYAA